METKYPMQFIDSHAHINADQSKNNWEDIVYKAHNNGVSTIINNAADLASTEWGIEQAEQSAHLYTTAGIHPEYFLESDQPVTQTDFHNLRRLILSSNKVVAVGEIGLDYTLDPVKATKSKQHELLINQLNLASELKLPVTLHVRDQPSHTECFNDLIHILQQFTTSNLSPVTSHRSPILGVFHCWVGNLEQAQQALALGFYLSFSGILTYKSAGHILDVAAQTPLDKILIETDAPYLTPEPARSREHPSVNEPKYVIMTAEKLANIRGISIQEIAKATSTNTRHLFNLPVND